MSIHYECRCNPCNCEQREQMGTSKIGTPTSDTAAIERNAGPSGKQRARKLQRCDRAGTVTEPPIGAHLVSPRWGYSHRGIYAGNDTVIHYAGLANRIEGGPVEEVAISSFARNRGVAILCRGPLPFADDEIVRRARSRLGEARYQLLTNNCEHFSEWAQFGQSRSDQVDRWLQSAAVVRAMLRKVSYTALRALRVARVERVGQEQAA